MNFPSRKTHPGILLALVVLAAPIPLVAQTPGVEADGPKLLAQPATAFPERRKELMKRLSAVQEGFRTAETVAVLRGADDRELAEGRFRQSNYFAYLTGVEVPGAWLILLPGKAEATLYLPPAGTGAERMELARPAPGPESAKRYGFDRVESTEKLLGDLFGAIADPQKPGPRRMRRAVYVLSPDPRPASTSPDARLTRFLKEGSPNTEFRDVAPILDEMRKAKSPTEIDLLKRAISITGDAQSEVVHILRPGLHEYQLEGKIMGAFLGGGAFGVGFPSIVGSGPNSTIPHYFANNRQMDDGELVVVDIGAEYQYYTADITRTYPVSGKFTPRQREVYQLVLDAQAEAAKQVKPGATYIHAMTGFVREYMRKSPLRAKDVNGREYTMDHFFIHGLGHYLGMDVHDVGDYSKPLQVGEVFTIEPGIYIKSENLGVRIEDDYVLTESGLEKLSKDIPSDPDEIEKRIADARGSKTSAAAENGKP
jgi:Xaa-Pro aminopeptidase